MLTPVDFLAGFEDCSVVTSVWARTIYIASAAIMLKAVLSSEGFQKHL